MPSYKKFVMDVGIVGLAELLIGLSGIILLPILTKNLPIVDYGIWVQFVVTLGLISLFATCALPFTMVRFLAAEKDRKEIQEGFFSIALFVLFTSLIISLLVIVFSDYFAKAIFDGATNIVRIIAIAVPIACLNSVFLAFFRTFQEMGKRSAFILIQAFGEIALVSCAVFLGYGLFGAVIASLIIRTVVFLTMLCLIVRRIGIKLPKFSRMREYLNFGLPLLPFNLSNWVLRLSSRYVIAYFLGTTFVGFYSAGYMLGNVLMLFAFPLGLVLPPTLSKLYDEGKLNEVKTHLRYSLKYLLTLAIPAAFGVSMLSKPLLTILSTTEIAAEGYLVIPFIAASTLLIGVYVIISQILILVKKTKIIGATWVLAAVVNIGVNILVVPRLGILGAAITTLIGYALVLGITAYYSSKHLTFDINRGFILKSIAASAIMSLVIWGVNPTGMAAVFPMILGSAAVYFAVLLLLRGFRKEEFKFFKSLLSKPKAGSSS